ncbi:hypothetical protein [Duganella phyllosphaerae]|uniref:Cofactor-independent phosphoglycerate mutase n=1 Tax=Duganella phyllosphaerae TaxID=762836 RepID=A0A1E7W6G1_9BURK|nr:hypothetical protein [Duganella phyllosphaerae]OEZ91581.1 cofactor-independent phosphoglycerate mutase [Duganella phyllosphaerae]
MTDIILALPFALPPADMAPHLLRALQVPALAALLGRHSRQQRHSFAQHSRVLPHEAWLTRTLDLAPSPITFQTGAPLATACMRGCGLQTQAAEGHWLILQPAHIQVSSTHPSLADPRALQLDEADARALYDAARPYFEELGKPMLFGAPGLWFVRADDWAQLSTASPDSVVNQNLGDWLPEGERARDFRRLQNEIQMLWHQHPVNAAREARGLPAVNSYWCWGGASASASADTAAVGAATLAVSGGPSWLQALAAPELRQATANGLIGRQDNTVTNTVAVVADLIAPGQASEWAEWIAALQHIDQHWCAPLLAALQDGRVGRVNLMLSHRESWLEVSSTKMAQRKFWRQPNLNLLK